MIGRRTSIGILIGCILSFFIGNYFSFFSFHTIERIASCMAYPVLVLQRSLVDPVKNHLKRRAKNKELQQELEVMHQQLAEQRAQIVALQAQLDYASDIAELIPFKKKYEQKDAKLAQVLLRQCANKGHFVLVDKGSRDGITNSMIAVYNNCLLGKVTHVWPWYSKIVLITDPSCKVGAYCVGTQVTGIHEGINSKETTKLQHVSHLSSIKEGDLILSSGEGLLFPRGFALGKIAGYTTNELQHDITVEPALDVSRIKYCYLLHKGS